MKFINDKGSSSPPLLSRSKKRKRSKENSSKSLQHFKRRSLSPTRKANSQPLRGRRSLSPTRKANSQPLLRGRRSLSPTKKAFIKRKKKFITDKSKGSQPLKRTRLSPKKESSIVKSTRRMILPLETDSPLSKLKKQFEIMKTTKKILCIDGIVQINLDGKLITIIGEHHLCNKTKISSTENNITIDKFILERISNNNNIKIMLEYIPELEDVNNIQSININLIYNTLLNNGHKHKIIPFDKRYYFLNIPTYFDYLFTAKEFDSKKFISDAFIDPFYIYYNLFFFDKSLYSEKTQKYLSDYLNSINNNFKNIYNEIEKKEQIYIKKKLIEQWIKVCDFFVLTEILKDKDEINEYIILIGDSHKKHLEDIFKNEIVARTSNGNLSGLYYNKQKIYKELTELALSHHFNKK